MNETIFDRISTLVEKFGNGKNTVFASLIGTSEANVRNYRNKVMPKADFLEKIARSFDVDMNWLLTGEGNMCREIPKEDKETPHDKKEKKLIPFYDDVISIGGTNVLSEPFVGYTKPNEYIDAGDWFLDATAAIRHYGESMKEYPSGCILALKELHDQRQIVWGRNYCIETDEMRVTKRLQAGSDDYLMAYSTNTETYPDGHLVHEPFRIYKDTIRRIFMVIGCVVKE